MAIQPPGSCALNGSSAMSSKENFVKRSSGCGNAAPRKGCMPMPDVSAAGGGESVTLDLAEQVSLPAWCTCVLDQVIDIDQVVAAAQGEALGNSDAPASSASKSSITSVSSPSAKLIATALTGETRPALAIDAVLPNQAALGDIGSVGILFQQNQGLIGVVQFGQELREGKLNDIATLQVDGQLQHIGDELDNTAAYVCASTLGVAGGLVSVASGTDGISSLLLQWLQVSELRKCRYHRPSISDQA